MPHTEGSRGVAAPRARSVANYALTGAGLLLLAWLLTKVDWPHLAASLVNANSTWLGIAFTATVLNVGVKAVRWKAMVRAGLGPALSFAESFGMVPVGVAAGALTPARTVDLGKPALLVVRHDAPFGQAVMLALWERLYDLAVLLLAGVAGAFLIAQTVPVWRWPAFLGAAITLVALLLLLSSNPLGRLTTGLARIIPRLSTPMESLQSVVAARDPSADGPPGVGAIRGYALGLSALALVLEFVRLHAVAAALGFQGSLWVPSTVFSVGSLAGLFSLVPGGIGVSEWSQGALWSLLAPDFAQAAAVIMVDRLLSYYGLVVVGALIMLFIRRAVPARTSLTQAADVIQPGSKAWWILPAYNEAANIRDVIRRISETNLGRPATVILVDDGSTDRTAELAAAEAARRGVELIVRRHAVNSGLPATLRDGLRAAAELAAPDDVAICLDADNSHDPRWAPSLLELVQMGSEVAICSRYRWGSKTRGVPFHRRVMSDGLNLLLRVFLPIRGVRDYTCGYRAYRVRTLQSAFTRYGDDLITTRSFACTAEVLLRLAALGVRTQEVPFVLRYDLKGGSSKMHIRTTVAEYLRLIARTRIAWRKRNDGVVRSE